MSDSPSESLHLDALRAGDEEAARQLFDRYAEQLVLLARKRISQRLASRIDAEDIVQSVFRTFFHRARQGQFQLADPDDLVKLLARITVHKTLKQVAYHSRAKRDAGQEAGKGNAEELLLTVCAGEPTPEEAATFLDQLEHFLDGLGSEDRQILALRMEGYGTSEVAEKMGISARKVRRLMERIRGQAEQEGWSPPEAGRSAP